MLTNHFFAYIMLVYCKDVDGKRNYTALSESEIGFSGCEFRKVHIVSATPESCSDELHRLPALKASSGILDAIWVVPR